MTEVRPLLKTVIILTPSRKYLLHNVGEAGEQEPQGMGPSENLRHSEHILGLNELGGLPRERMVEYAYAGLAHLEMEIRHLELGHNTIENRIINVQPRERRTC